MAIKKQLASESGALGAASLEAKIKAAAAAQIAADQALANAETLRKFKEKEASEGATAAQKAANEKAAEEAAVELVKTQRIATKAIADAKALPQG